MTQDEARHVEDIINAVLDAARQDDDAHHFGPVNWGDLSCRDVEERRSLLHGGEPTIYALIEEASPNATELCAYVQLRLMDAGFPDVVVYSEW